MHECKHEREFKEIFDKQNHIYTDTQLIKQAILGNGQPGLYNRVDNLEKEVRASRESHIKQTGFAAGVGAIVSLLFTILSKFI